MAQATHQPERATMQFDVLPDGAHIDVRCFAELIDGGISTIWRRAKAEADFPKPIRLSSRCTRWKVGDVRAWLAARAA